MTRFSNINMLLAFVTVAREGSVSRAASMLNLTQPAISHQIKRLGEETGITLFKRTSTGLQITHDGQAMLKKAEQVLEAMEEFRRSARKRAGSISGKLRIGTIVDPEFIRLGRLLSQLRIDFPDIETELMHGVSGDILTGVKRNQIDAGFYLSGLDVDDELGADTPEPVSAVKLADFSYRVIAPVGWESRVENADWKALAALPWIGTTPASVHSRLLKRIFNEFDCAQNSVALVDQEASMLEMVRSGVGLSLCRDSIALHEKQTYGLAVCKTVSIPASLSLITMERRKDNPTISALLDVLKATW
ncbi:LysR family transcriptional regulator [Thalassospira lohafexi]|uniref:LysR family transcriptional regulator n=1 Tax=Thalassospira lohafexi TaxID=744227 RepID=A0A2N3L7B0_9PROT|nr:LysR family transcriptional regulator [Thalassospira lohafexi]PKR58580.1 LysR family transcriptional regulator [Thalassospira lohafexi]